MNRYKYKLSNILLAKPTVSSHLLNCKLPQKINPKFAIRVARRLNSTPRILKKVPVSNGVSIERRLYLHVIGWLYPNSDLVRRRRRRRTHERRFVVISDELNRSLAPLIVRSSWMYSGHCTITNNQDRRSPYRVHCRS